MSDQFFSVSELNQFIKDVLNSGFPQSLWVCGEIQGYDRNREKSHIFFELVEKDEKTNEVKARISVVLFAQRKGYVEQILKSSANAFSLKDDIEVKFLCKVDFYAPHGAVRLTIENIDPVYTLGRIAQERQKLIVLLKANGTLDKNKQTVLSDVPLNIGLITSHDSAAYNDFVSEIKKSGYGFKIFLRNTLMQGKKTEGDVCKALESLQKIDGLDLIVITRGGGSIAELSCFDSQKIAEAIARCSLPVLSGIGHEINTTITDLAAYTFCKTPTAIAQFLVGRVQDFLTQIEEKNVRILELAQEQLVSQKDYLRNCAYTVQTKTMDYFADHRRILTEFVQFFKGRPVLFLKQSRENLKQSKVNLLKCTQSYTEQLDQRLKNLERVVEMASPARTLKRGFTITRGRDGKIVRNVSGVKEKDSLTTEVVDGVIKSTVQEVIKENQGGKRG